MFNIPRVPFLLVCNISAGHDGKVGCNNVEYTTVRLYCDWLNFLWHGVKACMQSFVQLILYKVASFPELGFIFLTSSSESHQNNHLFCFAEAKILFLH